MNKRRTISRIFGWWTETDTYLSRIRLNVNVLRPMSLMVHEFLDPVICLEGVVVPTTRVL